MSKLNYDIFNNILNKLAEDGDIEPSLRNVSKDFDRICTPHVFEKASLSFKNTFLVVGETAVCVFGNRFESQHAELIAQSPRVKAALSYVKHVHKHAELVEVHHHLCDSVTWIDLSLFVKLKTLR